MKRFTFSVLTTLTLLAALPFTALSQSNELASFRVHNDNPNAYDVRKLIYELRPGESVQDSITLENLSGDELSVEIYSSDGSYTSTGRRTAQMDKNAKEELGGWFDFENTTITLQDGEKRTFPFTLTVPAETELGFYHGGISVQGIPPEGATGVIHTLRVVTVTEVNVTTEPKYIPRAGELKNDTQANIFTPTPFFWGSLVVFAGSMVYFFVANRKEKKQRSSQSSTGETK